jgi:hypothetical protein
VKRSALLLLLIQFVAITAPFASERLVIPQGAAPDLNGEVRKGEWDDAAVIKFSVESKVTVQVRLKHDRTDLYLMFRFEGNHDRALVFPELLVDPRDDKSPKWTPDDWWLHVSGTDCEARGTFSDYSNCKADHPDWRGVPNYELSESPPPVEEIEMQVALAKLGVEGGQAFGMSVTVEYVPDIRASWPPGAELGSPSTWATVILATE